MKIFFKCPVCGEDSLSNCDDPTITYYKDGDDDMVDEIKTKFYCTKCEKEYTVYG